jgi:predicted peptidase
MKTSFFKTAILIFGVFVFVGCDSGGDDTVNQDRTVQDVIDDFKNLSIEPGINDISLESPEKGVYWNFRVIAPSDASSSNKRPLVIALHGASGGSATAHQQTACYVEPGLAALNAFIISPNAGLGEWFDQANQQQVIALLDLAKTFWDVDSSKVMVTGYSNGGNASWFYADFYPELFTASIAMASSYNPERSNGTTPQIDVPLYVIHGENDELFPLGITQEYVNKSVGAGTTIEFVVATGLTHYEPCSYVSYLQDAVTWVQANVWN